MEYNPILALLAVLLQAASMIGPLVCGIGLLKIAKALKK